MTGLLRKAEDLRKNTRNRSRTIYSGSLLARAMVLRERIKPASGTPPSPDNFFDKERDAMEEMDGLLKKNRLVITDETLQFIAQSSGATFPIVLNAGALFLILFLGFVFNWAFNRTEASLVAHERQINSAEGQIVEEVRRDAQREILRREAEIETIQGKLTAAEKSRAVFIAEADRELQRRENLLKNEFNASLEEERQRLLRNGLSQESAAKRLTAFEEQKRVEYEEKIALLNTELKNELEAQTSSLNSQMEAYRRSLVQAQTEQDSLKVGLEKKLSEAQRNAAAAAERAATEKSAVQMKLENLGQEQEQALFTQNQIDSMYDRVHIYITQTDYPAAQRELDNLELFVESPAVAKRRQTEQFLIESLRWLIQTRISTPKPQIITVVSDDSARLLTENIAIKIEKGNTLFQEGNLEAAKAAYTEALREIPAVETGYLKLRDIETQRRVEQPPPEPIVVKQGLTIEEKELLENAKKTEAWRQSYLKRFDQINGRITDAEAASASLPKTSLSASAAPSDASAEAKNGGSNEQSSQESLIALLNAKLLIRRILSDAAVREKYPDIGKTADSVLEAYGLERLSAGRESAIQDLSAFVDALSSNANRPIEAPTIPPDGTRQGKLTLQFLKNLHKLLQTVSP